MENTHIPLEETSNHKPHQVEDAIHKTLTLFFRDELLPFFHIEGEVDHIGPTETIHLELKKFYEDFNLVMKDGSWIHFEFQSSDNKALEDLKRFWVYEALTTYQHNVTVRTYVLYSGTITNPLTEFTSGFNIYRVQPIIMKGYRAEKVFENLTYKIENSIPLTKEDLVPLALCPLMSGELSQKDRFQNAFHILRQSGKNIPDVKKIEAVVFAMANKFLESVDFDELKEEFKMTELGLFLYNDGKADGIEEGIKQGIAQGMQQASRKYAKKLLKNGVPFEVVQTSIEGLTNADLQKIYNEVKASKENDQKN